MRNGDRPITDLHNIGESRRKAFSRLSITTLSELLEHYPRAYQNRGAIQTFAEVRKHLDRGETGPFSVLATVSSEPVVHNIRRGMTIIKLAAFDESGSCSITFFNRKFLTTQMHCGASFRFWGRFQISRGRLELSSPLFEPYVEGGVPLLPFYPVYPLTGGLTQKIMHQAINEAMEIVLPEEEPLPHCILEKYSLATRAFAVRNIHFPESEEALNTARRRLIFDELFTASVALGSTLDRKRAVSAAVIHDTDTSAFTDSLPYRLTDAQQRSLSEIVSDMASPYAMNRMLTGDVGSGKTVVAAGAAYISLKNGRDCLFMVPTEILAQQHYNDISSLFDPFGVGVYLLTGSTSASARRKIVSALESPEKPVLVIGTHALLSDDVRPSSPGLVIIDEQHRFGAMQRAALADKSDGINTLVMSATPIPRTLSLIMFGSLDISRIDELPAGRQPIDTFVVNESYRERLRAFIRRQVNEGHQVYIVCPAIEETHTEHSSESLEEAYDITIFDNYDDEISPPLKAVAEYSEELRAALTECRIAVVHGKMKPSERETIMSSFCHGEIDILVSTTVIEVGVNVPNATLMIVENAERFGLSQLHQLRGRVGRGTAKSYFIMVSDARGERAKQRLSTIKRCVDGYAIAEADLSQRGPGDIFAENGALRQHGESSLTLAARCTDSELISDAFEAAQSVIAADPALSAPEHSGIKYACDSFIKRSSTSLN